MVEEACGDGRRFQWTNLPLLHHPSGCCAVQHWWGMAGPYCPHGCHELRSAVKPGQARNTLEARMDGGKAMSGGGISGGMGWQL